MEEKGSFWAILFFLFILGIGAFCREVLVVYSLKVRGWCWCFGGSGLDRGFGFVQGFGKDVLRVYRVLVGDGKLGGFDRGLLVVW